jgi:hypothetical protein
MAVATIGSATASAILLSLPHGLPFSIFFEIYWAYRNHPPEPEASPSGSNDSWHVDFLSDDAVM